MGVGGVTGMRRRASPFKLNLAMARLFKPIVNLKPEYCLATLFGEIVCSLGNTSRLHFGRL